MAVSNGSPISWAVKPEDFRFERADGSAVQASPARAVVETLMEKGSRGDVMKLMSAYEASLYGNAQIHSTNGFEARRRNMMANGSSRLNAAAAASAIVLATMKLNPGQSTDGALFFPNQGRPLGAGRLVANTAGEVFTFSLSGEPMKGRYDGARSVDGQLGSRLGRFGADIGERDGFSESGREGRAGDFERVGFGSRGGGNCGVDLQPAQHAMDVGAAADALDDFLAEIAAFIEMDGVKVAGFLNQVALGDFVAVAGMAVFDADDARVFGVAAGIPVGGRQPARPAVPRSGAGDGLEDEEAVGAGGADARDDAIAPRKPLVGSGGKRRADAAQSLGDSGPSTAMVASESVWSSIVTSSAMM